MTSDRETVLQNIFDTISTGIFVVDIELFGSSESEGVAFRFVTTNPAYARMLSVPTNALAGLCPHDCLPPDIADRFCANYSRCLEQRQPISYEESLEFDARRCTVLTTLSPIFEPDGRISRIVGSSQDVTEYKRIETSSKPFTEDTEEALSQEKELLSNLIKNAPIGIISTDELGKILFVNPAFETICGYSAEELIGQTPPYPYWDAAELDIIYREFELAMAGEKENIELWFTRKNSERFLALLKPITIFDEQGNMLQHLATMEDITKYKQATTFEERTEAIDRAAENAP